MNIRKKNTNKQSKQKQIEKYFTISKLFLAITPIIAYAYVMMMASMNGLTLQELFIKDASITVTFVIAMINPYVAYLLDLVQKKLEEKDNLFVMINMIILLIAQAMTMNFFYFMMIGVVFYQIIVIYKIDMKTTLKQLNTKNTFTMGGGSFIVMSLSLVCLFSSIQLM